MNTARPDTDDLVERICAATRARAGDVRELVQSEVTRLAPLVDDATRTRLASRVLARLDGFGVIDDLLADPAVDEIMINRGTEVWIDRGGSKHRVVALTPGTVETLLERVLAPTGRRLDRTHPVVDARLPNGARLCAVVPPVAVDGIAVTVRRHRDEPFPLESFCGPAVAHVLAELIERRLNVLITGSTSTGKTSLLGAMLHLVDPNDRLVVIEDTAELPVRVTNGVRLESRPANSDLHESVDIDDLVVAAMRLRPDRLVMGEFRGTEVRAVVQALNTGHDGSLSTCHANSAVDGLIRMETLVMQAAPTWPLPAIRRQLTRSVDAIVHLDRHRDGSRRVATIAEVVESDEQPTVRTIAQLDTVVDHVTRTRR